MDLPATRILGSRVHMIEIPDILRIMSDWIETDRERCHQIIVSGMHGLSVGQKDPGFKVIINAADLFVPDGISAVWIGRLKGFKLKKRAAGADLMRAFFELANEKQYSNYFYGDTTDTLDRLQAKLRLDYPGMKVAGALSPPFRPLTPEEDERIIQDINNARPDILWVGLGLPKQERWIYERLSRLQVPIAVGVGAAFGFLSGKVRRAPAWVGDAGFEWLWRLCQEPKKMWKRDLLDGPAFLCHSLLELSGLRKYD